MTNPTQETPDLNAVLAHLMGLQDEICAALQALEPAARFGARELRGERGGLARPRVLSDGEVFDRAAVNFSHTSGEELPPAATAARPHLAGSRFDAASVSLIVHPGNPFVPTTHANFRFFQAQTPTGEMIWWFGGGFDLTPYYGFVEDAVHWHRVAKDACDPHGSDLYDRFKKQCDRYFYLPHRKEARGIGGLFFDDFAEGGFDAAFALVKDVSRAFLPAYVPLVEKRKDTAFEQRHVGFQRYRRGRYVEFNLAYDRGTRFGLQSGGRIESILASLPPIVHWRYDWQPQPGSEEARLYEEFLVPRDWLGGSEA